MRRPHCLAALAVLASTGASPAGAEAPVQDASLPAIIEGTSLVVLTPGGRRYIGQALVGAIVVGNDAVGGEEAFRIDAIGTDPDDAEIALYTLSTRNPQTGVWEPYCVPDARGVAGGFFLSGSWGDDGTHYHDERFSVTCTSGAIGKCVRYGYKPWKTAPDGRPMWDYHQACTRLMRADYCGDGQTHTRDGVTIEIIDRIGSDRIGSSEERGNGLVFEAAWTQDGATRLARPRLSTWTLETIKAQCPAKLAVLNANTRRNINDELKKAMSY